MTVHLRELFMSRLAELRYEPIDKRIRAVLGGQAVVDSTRAMLVWEPKRIVPSYAVPVDDIAAEVAIDEAGPAPSQGDPAAPRLGERPVYDPSIPFSVHTAAGVPLRVRAGDAEAAGFRPTDPPLADHALLDFAGFDEWYEEDERNLGHPRDPFHRIDILHSSRPVRVELDGTVVAASARPYLLFEPPLPVRYYLAPDDVRLDLLRASASHTICAYKGQASYWSLGDHLDVAWTYPAPLREAAEVTDRIAFFNERVDIVVDGTPLERPITPWSKAPA